MKTEVPTDLQGVRALLLKLGPFLERGQPGITAQLQHLNLDQPLTVQGKGGEHATVRFEPLPGATAIKIEVRPPMQPMGRLKGWFWTTRTRWLLKMVLKRAKLEVEKAHPKAKVDDRGVVTPEVLPPS